MRRPFTLTVTERDHQRAEALRAKDGGEPPLALVYRRAIAIGFDEMERRAGAPRPDPHDSHPPPPSAAA